MNCFFVLLNDPHDTLETPGIQEIAALILWPMKNALRHDNGQNRRIILVQKCPNFMALNCFGVLFYLIIEMSEMICDIKVCIYLVPADAL